MRQKTIKAIQNMRPQNIRARPAASSPRGGERSVISCRNPPQSRKIILCWRRRIMRRLRNGERSLVLFTAILMPPPSRANWIKRNATQPFSRHIISWPEGDLRTIHPRGELPLLERPFVLGHYDCWGLVMSYFRQTHGIELHDYRVDYPWWEKEYPDNFYQDCWYECGFREFDGPPQPGDMVIMQVQADKWNHAGILLEGNMLLHHLYGHLSKRVPYGGYWLDRTMKIIRYHSLC